MNEQRIQDFHYLGTTFAGVVVVIAATVAASKATLWRLAYWLAVAAEVCLLSGALLFDGFIWHVITPSANTVWWQATSDVLVSAGVVTGVVALIVSMRELALRGARGWMLLCSAALLVLVGADSAFSGYTLVMIFNYSVAYRLLHSASGQQFYFGVVTLLLAGAPLAPLIYAVRNGRARVAAAAGA